MPTLLDGLRELSRRQGTTLFVTLMAGLLVLLHRYTGQADLVAGTVSANRARPELASLIGFLVNTLPIRADLSGDPRFTQLLDRVQEAIVGAYAHQDLPFGKLVQTLRVDRDPSRAPVFQIALVYAERDTAPVAAAGIEIALTDLIGGIDSAKFDLTLQAEPCADGLRLECSYKTVLFDPATVDPAAGSPGDPAARRGRRSGGSAVGTAVADRRRAARRAGDVERHRRRRSPAVCVHQAFEAQAAATPGAVAAEFGDQQWSYAELDRHASQIGRRLRELGVGPEVLVGVCMQAGLTRLAALLGIWKAGGGYVPLDPALPPDRLAYMIADTAMTVVLTDQASAARLPQAAGDGGAPGRLSGQLSRAHAATT